jgi:hypothetical protein
VFRPLVGTDYQDLAPPRTEDVLPVFARLYEACMERGLPIGAAPDIHVSLVMLPEECRWLTPRRYPLSELKLKLLGRAVRFGLERRLRAREREFGPKRPHATLAPLAEGG